MAALEAGIARMKFGKLCEEACVELESQTKVPAFPYKALKKQLKKAEDADNACSISRARCRRR